MAKSMRPANSGALTMALTWLSGAVANTPTSVVIGNQLIPTVPMLGNVVSFFSWSVALSDAEMQRQYLRLSSAVRPQDLNRWHPMLNVANVAVDWSGQGHAPTVTGTYTDSRIMPPIPYR